MSALIIHHHIRNYGTWRPVYNDHEPVRRSAGLTNGRIFRAADDPNDLLILLDMADKERARTFANSDDLKGVMRVAGVEGRPEMYFAE